LIPQWWSGTFVDRRLISEDVVCTENSPNFRLFNINPYSDNTKWEKIRLTAAHIANPTERLKVGVLATAYQVLSKYGFEINLVRIADITTLDITPPSGSLNLHLQVFGIFLP